VGISSGLALALASSVVPMLLPLTRLTVGLPGREAGRAGNVSMFYSCPQDDLGSPYTPAARCSRQKIRQPLSRAAHLLVQALNSLLWLVGSHGACRHSFRFNHVIRS
jgi:hypothetical protein